VWSFGKRYRPLLGLDITTSSVKLIELTMSGGQYRVESYAAEPTPHNAINEKAIVGNVAAVTIVQSVETLAHLGLIARFGSDWFRQVGTSEEPGTRLVTLSGAVARAGVYEMPNGMGLAGLLEAAGSDPAAAALLVGGYSGSWLTPGQFPEAQISQAGLGKFNATLGAGVVHLLAPGSCAVWEAHRIVRWLAGQSAGPCGPCSHGLPALAEALGQLAQPLHASHQGVRLVKTLEHPG